MHYFVDGYNVTRRDPRTASLPLIEQREALIARLAVRGADLLGRGDITVVFDGLPGGGQDARRGKVEVRYSRGESADDLIVRLIEATAGNATVVTSDGGLAARVRLPSVAVVGAERCFEAVRVRRRRERYPASDTGLPPGANKVTEELKRLWLGDEE